MSIDKTTYNFCIESLRYIHKMIGYDAIIEELNFINHLHTPSKSACVPEHIANAMLGLDDMTEYESESFKDTSENKNIVIESKPGKNKYVRTELPDDKRCETILTTGNRCTFKRAENSVNCSRHSK
jgi:hypothetical protein